MDANAAITVVRERLQATPGALQELGAQALDLAVQRALRAPLAVDSADDVARLLRARPADTKGATGLVLGWLSGRLASRVLKIGTRFSIPMRVVMMAVPPLVQALRHGAYEVHALASLVVNRAKAEGVAIDARAVRRLVLGAYLWPQEPLDATRERASAPARLAWTWLGHAVDSNEGRVVEAATLLDAVDLRTLTGEMLTREILPGD